MPERVGVGTQLAREASTEILASDEALVAASKAEGAIFGAIFDRYADEIYRYIARRLGCEDAFAEHRDESITGKSTPIGFNRTRVNALLIGTQISRGLSPPSAPPRARSTATPCRHHQKVPRRQ